MDKLILYVVLATVPMALLAGVTWRLVWPRCKLAGRLGMELFIEIAYGLAADGHVDNKGYPNRLSHVALLMEMGDMRMPGMMFMLATPVLHWIARRARRRGVEAALIEEYCG
jgi:hypothetical protein